MALKKVSHVKYWWGGASLGPPDNSSDLPNFQLRSEGRVEARLGNCYDRSTVGYGCCAGLFPLGGHDLLSPLAAEGDTGMTRESREGETVRSANVGTAGGLRGGVASRRASEHFTVSS